MTKPDDTPLIRHLESHLGEMKMGWPMTPRGGVRVTILKFDDQPFEGAVTYTTLGLSGAVLHQGGSSKEIRQELLFSRWATEEDEDAVSLVMTVADEVLERQHALARGDVLGPAGAILPGSSAEALYCAAPVYFDDAFHIFEDDDPAVYFVWLLPITRREAEFVKKRGWDTFEDLLVDQDPDLLDLSRDGVKLK